MKRKYFSLGCVRSYSTLIGHILTRRDFHKAGFLFIRQRNKEYDTNVSDLNGFLD